MVFCREFPHSIGIIQWGCLVSMNGGWDFHMVFWAKDQYEMIPWWSRKRKRHEKHWPSEGFLLCPKTGGWRREFSPLGGEAWSWSHFHHLFPRHGLPSDLWRNLGAMMTHQGQISRHSGTHALHGFQLHSNPKSINMYIKKKWTIAYSFFMCQFMPPNFWYHVRSTEAKSRKWALCVETPKSLLFRSSRHPAISWPIFRDWGDLQSQLSLVVDGYMTFYASCFRDDVQYHSEDLTFAIRCFQLRQLPTS